MPRRGWQTRRSTRTASSRRGTRTAGWRRLRCVRLVARSTPASRCYGGHPNPASPLLPPLAGLCPSSRRCLSTVDLVCFRRQDTRTRRPCVDGESGTRGHMREALATLATRRAHVGERGRTKESRRVGSARDVDARETEVTQLCVYCASSRDLSTRVPGRAPAY